MNPHRLIVAIPLAILLFLSCGDGSERARALAEDGGPAASGPLVLELRTRIETRAGSGRYHAVTRAESWDPRETAVIVCDMWDLHHSINATRRGAELAPRMNDVLHALRARGATIIHAPSSCMDTYAGHPARSRAANVPRSRNLPPDIGAWCHRIPSEERGEYPIDQSDGGEDDDPEEHAAWARKLAEMGRNPRAPWEAQTDLLDIDAADYLSDDGEEIWSILEHKGIDNVILVGVHTNMCVLGRPFGLRQMAKNGKNVVLVRDLTDTMYNPARAPFVSHFTGTDLIVEHIEKFVCPTITSDQLAAGEAFRFQEDRRPRLVIVMAEDEYQTEETLPEFARKHLGRDFSVELVFGSETDRSDIPGLEALDAADVAFLSVRRRVLPPEQMEHVRRFVGSGKPLLGIRTANHAFALRDGEAPEGYVAWPEFDRDVIGGNYTGHHGSGPKVTLEVAQGAAGHPILGGIDAAKFVSSGSLYKVSPLADSAQALLIGSIPEQPSEPVAWVNRRKGRGTTFYTSLGHPEDFQQAEFESFLRSAISWMAGLTEAGEKVATAPVRGTVTFNGQPLAGAAMTLVSAESSRWATGTTDAAGRYVLGTFGAGDGAVAGEHTVVISKPGLPAAYQTKEKSPLRATVSKGGPNEFIFEIATP